MTDLERKALQIRMDKKNKVKEFQSRVSSTQQQQQGSHGGKGGGKKAKIAQLMKGRNKPKLIS